MMTQIDEAKPKRNTLPQIGCGIMLAIGLILLLGVLWATGSVNPIPRAELEARLEDGIAGSPYVLLRLADPIDGKAASIGLAARHSGLIDVYDDEVIPNSAANSAITLAAPSSPVILALGDGETVDKLIVSAWPSVSSQPQSETLTALGDIAQSVNASVDAGAVTEWIQSRVTEFTGSQADLTSSTHYSRTIDGLALTLTLKQEEAVTESGMQTGIRATLGITP